MNTVVSLLAAQRRALIGVRQAQVLGWSRRWAVADERASASLVAGKRGWPPMTVGPLEARTASVDQTQALAEAMADLATAGDLILLVGEMGAGKTAFAQGFAAGLGVAEQVTSPTFTIVHEYSGRLDLHHLDAYRLEHLQEVADLGVAEMLDEPAVMLVEWGDVILPALPADYLEVQLRFGLGDDDRWLTFSPVGSRWAARMRRLGELIEPFALPSGQLPPEAPLDEDGGHPERDRGGAQC